VCLFPKPKEIQYELLSPVKNHRTDAAGLTAPPCLHREHTVQCDRGAADRYLRNSGTGRVFQVGTRARRNLQGHWINGRQLRIDFAEKDKNREVQDHPAASNLGNIDPSTQYLAKMSREQLNEIITEMNALVAQNHPSAQQLLQRCPHLPQALSQAQTRLDMVPPQMMQVSSSSPVTKRALETTSEGSEEMNHRSKRRKLEQHSEKQTTQFLAEVESALLQQVMSLTPERISSLPLEEQQQVLHLQAQMLVN